MKIEWNKYKLNGGEVIEARATVLEANDNLIIRGLYFEWKTLNDKLKTISTRGINLPEAISENAFCLFFKDYVRVVELKDGKCSFDCLNVKTGERIQIKASSVESDLTSFGPRSEWDSLYFLDFSSGDGSFKVYKIEATWIYKHKVNQTQTFKQQQAQGKRPRFSIIEDIIKPRNLKPLKICQL